MKPKPDTEFDIVIRPERPRDHAGIVVVHRRAFQSPGEDRLVDLLRRRGKLAISLVAEHEDRIVGHIAFSPVYIVDAEHETSDDGPSGLAGLGLAPLAVLPEYQRQRIGTCLTEHSLRLCRESNIPFVAVLGDPKYYQRFGFVNAHDRFGLRNEYGAESAFQVMELQQSCLQSLAGDMIRFAPEFAELDI